jgi:hypothetical protein
MATICVNTLFLLRESDILETEVFVLHVVNPAGKEPRMTSSEFEQWCDRLQLPMSTRNFLLGLRSSPPARRVQGRLLNVSGTYASRKMGVSIQFESHTVVCGPSGVGKSRLAEVLTRRLNTPKQVSDLHGPILRRALLMNTRPPDGALFHRTSYYQKGLYLLGKTTYDRRVKVDITTAEQTVEKRPRGKTTPYQDNPEMRDAYEEELRRLTLRTVILDEARHLIQTSDGKQPKDQLNWIKSMTTETSVLHILIGTYDLLPFCNLDGQMARRGLEIHFFRYHIEDESDCRAFRNAFSSLLKQIPLRVDHDTLLQRWCIFLFEVNKQERREIEETVK